MSMSFASPTMRAAGNDLAISISPLGLVELSDEEFEVNGPRLSRYATSWAYYQGFHLAYRREQGEPQFITNYTAALADWLNIFCFGRGANFKTAPEYEGIIPGLLKKVWEVDNHKEALFYEMGQQGGVSGDIFVKVAWEPAFEDDGGFLHPGKCRILVINSAYCFPVDRTEILTRRGWLHYDELTTDDQVLSQDPETGEQVWADVKGVNVFDWDGPMHRFQNERFSALTTPDHRWMFETKRGKRGFRTSQQIAETTASGKIVLSGGVQTHFPTEQKYTDEFVELIGWVVTEGHLESGRSSYGFTLTQDRSVHPDFSERIDRLHAHYRDQGISVWKKNYGTKGNWRFGASLGHEVRAVLDDRKAITPEFLTSLTFNQATLLFNTMLDGDGDTQRARGEYLYQNNWEVMGSFQMLAMMLGKHSQATMRDKPYSHNGPQGTRPDGTVSVYQNHAVWQKDMQQTVEHYSGKVWCPTTSTGTWVVRFSEGDSKKVYLTGNCFPEWHPHDRDRLTRFKLKYKFYGTAGDGTRQIYSYTEILTPDFIEEYINDELIDQRPNPLGVIPVVHIPNMIISGTPWGKSDLADILQLNREYNEKMLEISDILNYNSAPVTILTGGTATSLERGAKKMWSIPSKDAKVFNLVGGTEGVPTALEYCQQIKRSMHELTGVPETALGQVQPISNTSGVALSITYQPAMQRLLQKQIPMGKGLQKINEYILKTLFYFDPTTLVFDPTTEGVYKEGQILEIDPNDPLAYQTEVHWPPPLPVDKLVKLNEIMMEMQIGLESKKGALASLGNEFPDQKMQEIFAELVEDAKMNGALDMVRARISAAVMEATGMVPGEPPSPQETPQGTGAGGAAPAPSPLTALEVDETNQMLTELVTQAYGTRLPQRRNPDENPDD